MSGPVRTELVDIQPALKPLPSYGHGGNEAELRGHWRVLEQSCVGEEPHFSCARRPAGTGKLSMGIRQPRGNKTNIKWGGFIPDIDKFRCGVL